jgi:hypothetical protein
MMAHMPDTAAKTKDKYCHGDNTHCARYMVFKALGREKVPADLFPVQVYRVDDIIMYGKG